MNLSTAKQNTFEKLFEKHSKLENTEIEARFGNFSNKEFTPCITQEQFSRIFNYFTNEKNKKHFVHSYVLENIKVYDNEIKKITNEVSTTHLLKKNLGTFNIVDYCVRVSFSNEKNIQNPKNLDKVVYEKNRERNTFICDSSKIKFDLDYYPDSNSFTIEMESIGCSYKIFYSNLVFLLQILQDSEVLISTNESKKVLMEYFKISHKRKFIGVQPETICISKLKHNTDYALTKKLDGLRCLLMNYEGNVYSISNTLKIKKLPFTCDYKSKFILDTEYYKGSYHVFDLCQSEMKLLERLEECFRIISSFVIKSNSKVVLKKYYFGDIYNNFKNLVQNLDNNVYDGIIVVKSNEDYNHSYPLKWKPLGRLTIDFQLIKGEDEMVSFMVCGEENTLIEFCKNKVPGNPFPDNSIVECSWTEGNFLPVKHREDKTKPNFIKVAQDNWNSIQSPFEIESLKRFQSRKQSSLFNMRRYHNWIKRKYIDKHSKDTVLDLACGKGGDFSKYIDSGFKYIEAYDIDKESLKEAQKRKNHYTSKAETKNVLFNINQKDLTSEFVHSRYKFDLIVCNFAFHYFYNTLDIFIANIIANSKKGTKILMIFFDKDKVKEVDNDDYKIEKSGDKIKVFIKDSVLHEPVPEFLVDINTVKEKFNEYDIKMIHSCNFEQLYDEWNSHGNCLSEKEKQLSFMNTACVFELK